MNVDDELKSLGIDPAEVEKMHNAMMKAAPKRLSDGASTRAREVVEEVLANFGVREEPEAMAIRAVLTDHLQAREDVKRLATRLRDETGGHNNWCPALYPPPYNGRPCECPVGALLREVDS